MRLTLLAICLCSLLTGCFALSRVPQPAGDTNAPTYVVNPAVASAIQAATAVSAAAPAAPWSTLLGVALMTANSLLAALAAWKSHGAATASRLGPLPSILTKP